MYDPPYSPWCSSRFYAERWGEMHFRRPAGMQPGKLLPNQPYADPVGATVHAWRPGHWYSWMFEVNGTTPDGNFTFGRGGNQGGEGADTAAEWWIENVLEELDAPNEFFYDKSSGELHFYYNGTGPTPPAAVVVPTLIDMLQIKGTQASPVTNISLLGLKITANRPSFMEPRANPSGGDWALERRGAILVEGATNMLIQDCEFTRLDSKYVVSVLPRVCVVSGSVRR